MCTHQIDAHLPLEPSNRQTRPPGAFHLPAASRLVDLTHVLHPSFPIWPGEAPIEIAPVITFEKDGCSVNRVTASEHIGTHLDAPRHFWHGPSADELDPAGFFAPLVIIDIRARAAEDADAMVNVEDLATWERLHEQIPGGAFVAMLSGWEQHIGDPFRFLNASPDGSLHFPGFSEEAATWLAEQRDVVGIGVDTLSIDAGFATNFPVHKAILPRGCYAVENLARLGDVPQVGATIIVGAPKHRGASGGQCRVFAVA